MTNGLKRFSCNRGLRSINLIYWNVKLLNYLLAFYRSLYILRHYKKLFKIRYICLEFYKILCDIYDLF